MLEVYAKAPQGVLDTPVRVLCGFAKTKELAAGEEEHIILEIPKNTFASYDDSGVTGHRDCFVLLEGTYTIYVGTDVRTAQKAGSYPQTFTVIEQLEEVCAPQKPFARMTRKPGDVIGYSDTPERIYGPYDRVENRQRFHRLAIKAIVWKMYMTKRFPWRHLWHNYRTRI